MKRIIFLIVACVALFAQCTHPYEADLLGSFPFAKMLSPTDYEFISDPNECKLTVSTNMLVTSKVTYTEGTERDWVTVEISDPKRDTVNIVIKVDENIRRESRKAEIKILVDGNKSISVVKIKQKEYSVVGKENVYEGDLVIEEQDEVDNCIYTKVDGNLIIGSLTSEINDISRLSVIKSITGGVKVVGCVRLTNMGELGNLTVSSVEFDGVNSRLVETWNGAVKEVVVKGVMSGEVNLKSFKNAERLLLQDNYCQFKGFDSLTSVKIAEITGNEISTADGLEKMTSLDTLDLRHNPLKNVNSLAKMDWIKKMDLSGTSLSVPQINYLKEMLPTETEILSENISGKAAMTLENTKTEYFRAYFDATYSSLKDIGTYGYVLMTTPDYSKGVVQPLPITPNPLSFTIKDLVADTGYYMWLFAVDENNSIHISDMVEFKTPEIVYNYKGDLVLETQDDIDNCVHETVSGNLIIGKEDSDIVDLSKLTVTEVGGGVIVKGCHLLNGFGRINEISNLSFLELDNVTASLLYQWEGSVSDLRIRNISTGTVSLSDFGDITELTLQDNASGFTGFQYLTNVTDADLSGNQFTTTDDFKKMTALKNLDLSNNPLVNVNSLAEMKSLQSVDLSETNLSETQINYLKTVMPSSVNIVSKNLRGIVTLGVENLQVKYHSAKFYAEFDGLSSVEEVGVALSKTGQFTMDESTEINDHTSPITFEVKNLDDNTQYYAWFYIKDNVGSFHLSAPLTFRTVKIVENYIGDLVLRTQEEVEECVHTSVTGNLTIGGNGTDINDLSSLDIKSVTGDLTIKACYGLSDFGALSNVTAKHVIIDSTSQSITKTWKGNTTALTVKNIKNTTACNLSCFDEITKLTLQDNNCTFSNLGSLVKLTEAYMPRNKIVTTDDMETWTKLKTLDLSGNPLTNVNSLVTLKNLTSIDLSSTPLSLPQVRYLQMNLPTSVTITSTGITGKGEAGVHTKSVKNFSAVFTVDYTGISEYGGGYYISPDSSFPGESGRNELSDSYGSLPTEFKVSGLEDGTTYYIWLYVEDNNDSIHLSNPTAFTTNKVHYYSLNVSPAWPSFKDDTDYQPSYGGIASEMIVLKEDVIGSRSGNLMPSGNKYSIELPQGRTVMGLFAVEGVPEGNKYDGYSWKIQSMDMDEPGWLLRLDSEDGSGSDIVMGTLRHDFQSDASCEVEFIRPVAKLSVAVDFTGSVGSLDGIKDINISMENHSAYCHMSDTLGVRYLAYGASDLKTYTFSKTVTSIPDDKKINVAQDRFIFPHVSLQNPSVSVTINFRNGTSKTVKPTFKTRIDSNKVYDITFNVAITDSNGSFTVDEVIEVEDNIEF